MNGIKKTNSPMSSRDKILSTVKGNQPAPRELPPLPTGTITPNEDLTHAFISTLEAIGGAAYIVSGFGRMATMLREKFPAVKRVISNCPELTTFAESAAAAKGNDPHTFENVDLAILPAHFGVAENGACWITESQMIERVLPFIAQHLVLVIPCRSIVPNMHAAYDRIASLEPGDVYGFSTFIAGPSKTADIEQSLVLGAHGPMSLTVFLLDEVV